MNTIKGLYNDYDRKTYRYITFDIYDKLPAIGDIIEDIPHGYQSIMSDYIDITHYIDIPPIDNGYYSLYKIWKNVKQYELDDNDIEQLVDDGEEIDYIAVWTPYSNCECEEV